MSIEMMSDTQTMFEDDPLSFHCKIKLEDMEDDLCKSLEDCLSTSNNVEKSLMAFLETTSHEKILNLGISLLWKFVQNNWTGPFEDTKYFESLRPQALKELSKYEEMNENVVQVELLYLSMTILSNPEVLSERPIAKWWLFRTHVLLHSILDENSSQLSKETEAIIASISDVMFKNDSLKVLCSLELSYYYIGRKDAAMSEKYVDKAQRLLKLELNLDGALGKRTRYQQEEKPQLFLNIKTGQEVLETRECTNLPKPLALNDELRLEKIQFSHKPDAAVLGVLEESALITKYFQMRISEPRDNLMNEKLTAYLEPIVENSKNWPLKMSALYQRCKLESDHKRTVERSMMQLEHLTEQMRDEKPNVEERLDFFFSSGMKPIWTYKQSLADLMLNLGMVKSALDIYLNLKLWEDVIVCYTILELKHKAAEIIQQELEKKVSIKLLCLLGDVLDNEKYYKEAWEFSKMKSSRAQRHWGLYYYSKKKFAEAIPHLQKSVELNNIQENVWLKLGYAALTEENWKLASTAYFRYCELERGNYEAWNNLAKALIKLNDKQRAWYCLKEAVKYNFDRWEVWDNLMVTSVDLKLFGEVINCYHRLLDLKGQHLDVEVLEILKIYLVNKFNEPNQTTEELSTIHKLLENGLKLFGRLTSLVVSNSEVWLLYGTIAALKDNEKASQHLQRAFRTATSDPTWCNQRDNAHKVLDLCVRLAETYLTCVKKSDSKEKSISMLGSAKLSLQSAVTKVKMEQLDDPETNEILFKVEKKLKEVVEELDRFKKLP